MPCGKRQEEVHLPGFARAIAAFPEKETIEGGETMKSNSCCYCFPDY